MGTREKTHTLIPPMRLTIRGMINGSIAHLRDIEAECVRKIVRKADRLQREEAMPRSIALGRAIRSLPGTSKRYLRVRSQLGLCGVAPIAMK